MVQSLPPILLAAVEERLGEEVRNQGGYILPVGAGRKVELAGDIKGLRGGLGIVETMKGDYASSDDGLKEDFEIKRLGANPPETLLKLRTDAERSIFAAAGVPLLSSVTDGTALREAMRRFLHSTLTPVTAIALEELRLKLGDAAISIDYSGLGAADITGKAKGVSRYGERGNEH